MLCVSMMRAAVATRRVRGYRVAGCSALAEASGPLLRCWCPVRGGAGGSAGAWALFLRVLYCNEQGVEADIYMFNIEVCSVRKNNRKLVCH